jgi:Divergent InlB B-repeat domain
VTHRTRRALAASLVGVVALSASAAAARPAFRERRVVFVTLAGHGSVSSTPRGIACPATCRSAAFYKSEVVRLTATPAQGWRLARWSSSWCTAKGPMCVLTLTDSHDCAHGACPIGAFGVRVTFVRRSMSG